MKRTFYITIILCAALVFLSPVTSMAQYKSVVMGVKVAPSIGWLRVDQDKYSSEGAVPGISWGLIADFHFAENYALSTGFNVSFHNGKISYPDINGGDIGVLNRSYRLKYVDVPLLIKMKTNDIGSFRFFGLIGVQPGVRIGSKGKDSFSSGSAVTYTKDWHNIDSQTKLFRVAMVIGAGVEYPIDNSTAIIAGINFLNGFSDVLKNKNVISLEGHKAIPNAFELSLGVVF